jgi:hypothetical protein
LLSRPNHNGRCDSACVAQSDDDIVAFIVAASSVTALGAAPQLRPPSNALYEVDN